MTIGIFYLLGIFVITAIYVHYIWGFPLSLADLYHPKPSGGTLRKKLISYLSELISGGQGSSAQMKSHRSDLVHYKYFTSTLHIILKFAREFGASYRESLVSLREQLRSDDRFEKQVKQELMGGLFQFLLIIFCTWGFYIASVKMLETQFNYSIIMKILALELLGVSAFLLAFKALKQKCFAHFQDFYHIIYVLMSLTPLGLPLARVLELSQIAQLNAPLKKITGELALIKQRLSHLIEVQLKQGIGIQGELKLVAEDIQDLEKLKFQNFLNLLMALKLAIIFLFILPSYLLVIYQITQILEL
jgi:hypothetical protein